MLQLSLPKAQAEPACPLSSPIQPLQWLLSCPPIVRALGAIARGRGDRRASPTASGCTPGQTCFRERMRGASKGRIAVVWASVQMSVDAKRLPLPIAKITPLRRMLDQTLSQNHSVGGKAGSHWEGREEVTVQVHLLQDGGVHQLQTPEARHHLDEC